MIDAVLLDWENVLVDTVDARREARQRALAEQGVGSDTPLDATLESIVAARATRAFAERIGKGFVVRDGARELIERMQVACRVAIVTTATRAETEFMLRLAALDAAPSTIVSADDGDDVPTPAAYRRALEQLARRRPVNAERSVAIVATASSLRAARLAGLRTLAFGLPAHVAVEAHGALGSLHHATMADIARAAGMPAASERHP